MKNIFYEIISHDIITNNIIVKFWHRDDTSKFILKSIHVPMNVEYNVNSEDVVALIEQHLPGVNVKLNLPHLHSVTDLPPSQNPESVIDTEEDSNKKTTTKKQNKRSKKEVNSNASDI